MLSAATQASDSEPGYEARRLLKHWGLTIEAVITSNLTNIATKIAKAAKDQRRSKMIPTHIQNLLELELYPEAAQVLRKYINSSTGEIKGYRDELSGTLSHAHSTTLRPIASEEHNKLPTILKTGPQQQAQESIHYLRVIDP
ncbi:MAG: hypothetical protein M2R45_03932 [Verrucomicrobia subdivision 3 bacterium]|nr:hypothetical protein [Limisphaerales bacterium]MCS1417701.1 hypothetical protein [Limisphaerales bacterium]